MVPGSSSTARARRAKKGKRVTFEGRSGGRGLGVMNQGKAREAGISNVSKLKVLGGSFKGRVVKSPDVYLRPMMGKVKEAVFSTVRR